MSDVFISYSRLDVEFVGKLREALAANEQDVWIDWESIPESRAWWDEIKKGIARANNFAVVLSPHSIASPICQMEIEYALELNKRVIPIYHVDFDRKTALLGIAGRLADDGQEVTREIWESRQPHEIYDNNDLTLKRINYFFFKQTDDFEQRFQELLEVIHTDYDYKEQHTTIEVRASEWRQRGMDNAYLLIGNELKQAQAWLMSVGIKEPKPTELHYDFIKASERRNRQLQTVRWTAIIGSIVAAFAIVVSLIAGQNALTSTNKAATSEANAINNRLTATVAQGEALLQENIALTSVADANMAATEAVNQAHIAETSQLKADIAVANAQMQGIVAGTAEAQANLASTQQADANANLATAIVEQGQAVILANEASTSEADAVIAANEAGTLQAASVLLASTAQFEATIAEFAEQTAIAQAYIAATSEAEAIIAANQAETQQAIADEQLATAMYSQGLAQLDGGLRSTQAVMAQTDEAIAQAEVFNANATLSPIPSTLAAVATIQDESYRFQMAGNSALLQSQNENDSLAFAYEAIGIQIPPADVISIFYDVSANSHNRLTLWGHSEQMEGAIFSREDNLIATWSTDTNVKIWDLRTGIELANLPHQYRVQDVKYSPNGAILATASWQQIRIWETATWTEVAVLQKHNDWIENIAFNHNGEILATAGCVTRDSEDLCINSEIRFWDMTTGHEILAFDAHTDSIREITFSPNGELLVSSSCGARFEQTICQLGEIKFWNAKTGELLEKLNVHTNVVLDLAFNSNGIILASSSADRTIKLWDVNSKQELITFSGHTDGVNAVSFNSDDTILASASNDKSIKLWDVSSGNIIEDLLGHDNAVKSIEFSHNNELLASTSCGIRETTDQFRCFNGQVKLWDVKKLLEKITISRNDNLWVNSVDFSPNGKVLAIASSATTIDLIDSNSGYNLGVLEGHQSSVWDVEFHPAGKYIASSSSDSTVKIWDVRTQHNVITLQEHKDVVMSLSFNHDGSLLASAGCASRDNDNLCTEGEVIVWNTSNWTPQSKLELPYDSVWEIAMSPNQNVLAIASQSGPLVIWDYIKDEIVAELTSESPWIFSVDFSSDGNILVSSDSSGAIKLWDMENFIDYATLTGQGSAVASVKFSPDDLILASSGFDQSIVLWDVVTERQLLTLHGHSNWINSVDFDPQGTSLASGSSDATAKVWNIGSLPLMRQWGEENRYIREFTCAERERFNMPVQCNPDGEYPTRTPFPTPSPIAVPSWTPFWTPIPNQNPAYIPPSEFTPFYFNPTWIAEASYIPTPTITVTPYPIDNDFLQEIPLEITSGDITHDNENTHVEIFDTELILSNFVIDVVLTNPYSYQEGKWDYGLFFRRNDVGQYRLILGSEGEWQLRFGVETTILQSGSLADLNIETNESNRLRLEVDNIVGRLYINNRFITNLDLSEHLSPGKLQIGTGFNFDSAITGKMVRFSDLLVSSIGEIPTLTPTATSTITATPTTTSTPHQIVESAQPLPIENTSGDIIHDNDNNAIEIFDTGFALRNFIVEVEFENPFGNDEGDWTYGLVFRRNENAQYWLILESDREWRLLLREEEYKTIQRGSVANLLIGSGESNKMRVEVNSDQGLLYVNDLFVVNLDVSDHMDAGDLQLGTGFIADTEITGEIIRFSNLLVSSFGEIQTLRLTATPTSTPTPRQIPVAQQAIPVDLDTRSGDIIHNNANTGGEYAITGAILANFVADVTFTNPYSADENDWNYGVSFRSSQSGVYFLILNSTGRWQLELEKDTSLKTVQHGKLEDFSFDTSESNRIYVEVYQDTGILFVNDQFVANLDLSQHISYGRLDLFTGFYLNTEITGKVTQFSDLSISAIGEILTMTPVPTATSTATPMAVAVAQRGENRGTIDNGAAELWYYDGQVGEVVTITVKADDPVNLATDDERIEQGLLDTILIVYNPDEVYITENDDIQPLSDGKNTDSQIIELELQDDGLYTIEVRSWANTTSGGYTLIIESDQ